MADQTTLGATTAAGISVAEPGATDRLAGPGTGRATSPPGDVRAQRVRSSDPDAFGRPTGREEEWRFTPLRRLGGLLDGAPSDAQLSWKHELPGGVEVVTLSAGDVAAAELPRPADYLAAVALRESGGAVVVRVPRGASYDEPLVLRLHGTGDDAPVWGHVVLDIGAQAQATVVLEHTGSARYAAVVSVVVGDAAVLDLVSAQLWDDDAVHVAHHAIRLGRDAQLRSAQVSMGGDLVRITETVDMPATGADAQLSGLLFADAGQHLEHRLFVDHQQPHCKSRVNYKAALQGEGAHSVWVGDVLIGKHAVGTDTYEINRNLVLTDGARADSVPNLEIETGEITGAGHASATGRFDDLQLFYLMARGIPADEARRLVVRGFFAEIIGQITVTDLRDRLLAAVDAELERSVI
ncbi:MAG TPA: Fe-S cluster assembly protein SufD [Mycobacteriales bacterium]|nr:Fe-S cluster assembly protein SufD [Mycobacteriales bacterium]